MVQVRILSDPIVLALLGWRPYTDSMLENVTILDDGRIRINDAQSVVVMLASGIELVVEIEAGFISDGASIPRFGWWLVGHPYAAEHVEASVAHDWWCDHAYDRNERLIGDAVFRLLLARHNVTYWKQIVFWLGVYLQGRFIWKPKVHR